MTRHRATDFDPLVPAADLDPTVIIPAQDVGLEPGQFRKKSDLFETMEIGETVRIYAPARTQYSAWRGAAYVYGERIGMKFRANRVGGGCIDIVCVGDAEGAA